MSNDSNTTLNMAQESKPDFGQRIYYNSEYVRCDKGDVYCGNEMVSLTTTKCIDECLKLNFNYAGTMDKFVIK